MKRTRNRRRRRGLGFAGPVGDAGNVLLAGTVAVLAIAGGAMLISSWRGTQLVR